MEESKIVLIGTVQLVQYIIKVTIFTIYLSISIASFVLIQWHANAKKRLILKKSKHW